MTRRSPDALAAAEGFFAGIDTIPAMLSRRAELTPDAPAYFVQRADDAWHPTTWTEVHREVACVAEHLRELGIAPGHRIGILARTSLDWEIAQMAVLTRGAIVVGIDPYYPDALIEALIDDLGLAGLVVQDRAMLARLSESTRKGLRLVLLLNDEPLQDEPHVKKLSRSPPRTNDPPPFDNAAQAHEPAVVTFSSGSTGRPKPILYTHAQVVHACRCILALYPELASGTRLVCWLPLANLFQRMINLVSIAKGGMSYIVSDPRKVMEALPAAKPEVFVAVPQFCERVHAGIVAKLTQRPALARVVEAATRLSAELHRCHASGARVAPMKRMLSGLADRAVLSRLRSVFGGKLRFIVTGSAPMPAWLLERYAALGIPVLEAYGVSENLVPIAANRLSERKAGTVGKPVADNVVRIAPDGQVEVRGTGVFVPTLGENAARALALTDDGFLATGDIGSFDDEGFLVLHGRRSEAFKNAQGRWVSLTEIEAALRRVPGIEHAAVIRLPDERLVGVLALPVQSRAKPAPDVDRVERQLGPALRENLQRTTNELPRAMRPFAFIVVCAGFSAAGLDLTTNLKLRRAAIAQRVGESVAAVAAADSGEALIVRFT